MKPSRYNHFFVTEDGVRLAFNAASGVLAEIDDESHPRVQNLLAGGDDCPASSEDLRAILIDNGFLIDDTAEELSALHERSLSDRHDLSAMSLTIAPTLACNFDCDYCFERHSAVRMDDAVQSALLEFVERRMEHTEKILVTWFGGEPTLCLPIIERVQSSLNELAAAYHAAMPAGSIITNGYLLDRARAKRLRGLGIVMAQVTLDGDRVGHDARRKLRSGRGTFDRILANIEEIADQLLVVVRINIDRRNCETAMSVLQELDKRNLLGRVKTQFAQVHAGGEACDSIRGRCYTDREFASGLVDLYSKMVRLGLGEVEYPAVFSGGHCGAVSENCYVIAPNGLVFRCWEELSLYPDRSVGSVLSDEVTPAQRENMDRYVNWDPFTLTACRECEVMPICMGGCPLHGINSHNGEHGACSPYRFNLYEMLALRHAWSVRREVKS